MYIIFSVQGKHQWSVNLPDSITAMELLDYQTKGIKGVIVAMGNKEVRIFRGQSVVHTLKMAVSITMYTCSNNL